MSRCEDGSDLTDFDAERLACRLTNLPRESMLAAADALFAHSPVGLILLDRSLICLRLNNAFAEMNGVPLGAHLGRLASDLVPNMMRSASGAFLKVFETGKPLRDFEVRGESPQSLDLKRIWRDSAFPIKGADGTVDFILVSVEELTPLERAERRAALAESQLDLILRVQKIGTFEHGETLDDITWSPTVYEFYGLAAGNAVPLTRCLNMTPPEDRARLDEMRRRTLAGEVLPPTEYPIRLPDGETRWISVVARCIETTRGRRIIGVYENITERIQTQTALQESEARKAYLLRLSDALRPLADPVEIEEAACRLIAEELPADRVHYTEIDPEREGGYIHFQYRRRSDAPSVIGWHEFANFPSFKRLLAGETFIETDVASSTRMTQEEKKTLRIWGVGAVVDHPVFKEGRVIGELVVASETPRSWTTADLSLIEDTAERTWAAAERARAEAALRRSERMFRTLADAVPALVWHTDADGNALFLNQRYLDFVGQPVEALSGRQWGSILHPDDVAAQSATYLEASRYRHSWHGRLRMRYHNGSWRWIDAYAEPFVDDAGAYQGQVGVGLDVTDHVAAEEALRDSEGRFRTLVEEIKQVFYVADLKKNVAIYVSPAFDEVWGQSSALLYENLGSLIETILAEDRGIIERHVETTHAGRASICEYRIVRPNGSIRWILDKSFPVLGAEGCRSAGLAMDVTDQKELALALALALAQKDVLLGEIQHRVKNRLAMVTSLLNLQAGRATEISVRDALSAASGRVRIIARLHDQLYRMGDVAEVDLGATLYEVAHSVEEQAGRPPHIRLTCEVKRLVVSGEVGFPACLIVNELVTNAYKYAFTDGRLGNVRVTMDFDERDVCVVIADDGIGMPLDETREGLGATIIRGLTSQLRGTLVRSTGPGSTFRLSFPLNRRRQDRS